MWKTEEERDRAREKWLKDCIEFFDAHYKKSRPLWQLIGQEDEDIELEERNDVYLYKMLRYPPKTTPPAPT